MTTTDSGSSHAAAAEPLACTLDTGDQQALLARWRELKHDSLISESRDGLALTSVWQRRGDVPERLKALVEAERVCCTFLSFEVEELDQVIRVRTVFPAGTEALLESFTDEHREKTGS